MYFYELHIHTAETSICGHSSARDMVAAYWERGFSGVVITDHFVNGHSYSALPETWEEKMNAFVKGYHAAKEAGDELGIPVYFGVEYTADRPSGEDYLLLGLKEADLYQELVDCDQWPLEQVIDKVHMLGGIVVHAHPYRIADYILRPAQERPGLNIDAVEVFNGGNQREIYNLQAVEMALREQKAMVAGSDTHSVGSVATNYIGLEEKPENYAQLCEMIREGKVFVVHKPKQQ